MAAIDTLDWRLLQVFLVAAEAGSLGRAAAALGDYLVHSERIVLAAYARRIPDTDMGR